MIQLKLKNNFKNRFENFLSSDLFHNQPKHAKSSYWKFHSKKITYSINNSTLILDGKSGNSIPDKKNSYNFYLRSFKNFTKKIIGLDDSKNLSYKKAFAKIMSDKRIPGYQQVKFDEKKLLARNFSDCKKIFKFDYAINEQIIRCYYHINILNSYMELSKKNFVVEIGAGNGNLMSLLKHHFNSKCIIDIDLPETLILCIPFIENLFPSAKILLPNEINEKISKEILSNYDFIFLTPAQIKLMEKNLIDLFINTSSFMEMNLSQIKEYIDFIQNVGKEGAFFFCHNNVEKIPYGDSRKDKDYTNIKPTRFFEYPFFNNEILLFQICKFTSLVQNIPSYVRLEKLKKC